MNAVGHMLMTDTQEKSVPSKTTAAQWMADQQALVGVSDHELASALGYESPSLIRLFKSGIMQLPLHKVPALASALNLNPGVLMRRLLQDMDPNPLHAIEHCLGALCLSDSEQKLITAIRKANPEKEPVLVERDSIIALAVA